MTHRGERETEQRDAPGATNSIISIENFHRLQRGAAVYPRAKYYSFVCMHSLPY